MCLIIYKPKEVELPEIEHFKQASINNPDGIGIMVMSDTLNHIKIKKDFKDYSEVYSYLKNNTTNLDSIGIHFRLATSGIKSIGNRHPFPVTQNKELLIAPEVNCRLGLMHNGVLSQYSNHPKLSDSQKFIMDIIAEPEIKENLENPAVRKLIENYICGDKLLIFDSKKRLIHLFGNFTQGQNGCIYSNLSYTAQLVYYREYEKESDYCDGCNKYSELKEIKYKRFTFNLCKNCRIDLNNKNSRIHNSLTSGIEEEFDTVLCDYCGSEVKTAESKWSQQAQALLCKECLKLDYKFDF